MAQQMPQLQDQNSLLHTLIQWSSEEECQLFHVGLHSAIIIPVVCFQLGIPIKVSLVSNFLQWEMIFSKAGREHTAYYRNCHRSNTKQSLHWQKITQKRREINSKVSRGNTCRQLQKSRLGRGDQRNFFEKVFARLQYVIDWALLFFFTRSIQKLILTAIFYQVQVAESLLDFLFVIPCSTQ